MSEQPVVVPFPDRLERLAEKIKDAFRRSAEGMLDAIIHLSDARAQFPSDKLFGQWLKDNAIEMGHQDRAAAIAMGQDIERARKVLGSTKRKSLQHIYSQEFRTTQMSKAEKPKPQAGVTITPQLQKGLDAYDRRSAAGEELTKTAVQEEAGVSNIVARKVFAIRQTEAAVATGEAAALSASAREKLEAAIRAHKRKLDLEYDHRVSQACVAWSEEYRIPAYLAELASIRRLLTGRQAVMSRAEYNIILRCLHPDGIASRTAEQLGEAFRIFTTYKLKLYSEEEEEVEKRRQSRSTLPQTREELLARKKKK